MKRIITGMLFGFLFIFPTVCTAAYVIHLKDGRSFTTPEYREEGDQIKFEQYGGLIGIPKDRVKKIEEIADSIEEKKKTVASKTQKAEKSTPAEPQEAMGGEKDKQEEMDQIDVLLEEKRYLEREIKRIYSKFKEAKSKADKKTQQGYFQELKVLRGKLLELEQKVKAVSGGKLPDWWWDA
jgi:DNA repair exonuclease SbcCD ATPase subunit